MKYFAYYLYGMKFRIVTDHRGLVNLMSGKQENRRLYGWVLKLSDFVFEIVYMPGRLNTVPDSLSRCFGDGDKHLPSKGGDVGSQDKRAHIREDRDGGDKEDRERER